MVILYNIFIKLFGPGIQIASIKNKKAKDWIKGRKDLFEELKKRIPSDAKIIWIHASSAGEFEQAKPLIEKLKEIYPHHKVLVSFFSPSGFAAGMKYKQADFITYLPLDTASNANRFLSIVKPELVIFIKYDFWYQHLKAIHKKKIPLLLVSAIFRDTQPFFKWYGGLHRKMLGFFNHLFVQDKESSQLLNNINVRHCSVTGDTRFDRVMTIAGNFTPVPLIEQFALDTKLIVAGSTWKEDEELLASIALHPEYKFIIVPHEISAEHIYQTLRLFPGSIPYSQADRPDINSFKTLIIDNYGMLSRIYKYATIAYIGGGFNKSGIHNTLEAVVFGKPVLFGPNYEKFKEARELIAEGAAFSVSSQEELSTDINELFDDNNLLIAGQKAGEYVKRNAGATIKIIDYIQEKRLLTR